MCYKIFNYLFPFYLIDVTHFFTGNIKVMNRSFLGFVFAAVIIQLSMSEVNAQVLFPLKLSADNRHLVDQNNKPFLINSVSSWSLGAAVPTMKEVCEYLDSVKIKGGVNSIMMAVTSIASQQGEITRNNNYCWGEVCPFRSGTDFSHPNEAYFDHIGEIIDAARSRDMLIILGVSYLGYEEVDGWQDEIVANGPEKCRDFGRYLGGKFKDRSNIIWFAGGDYDPLERGPGLQKNHLEQLFGVKDSIPNSLWMAHWHGAVQGGHPEGVWATEEPGFAAYMDINSYYAFTYTATYTHDIKYYNTRFNGRPKMTHHMDMAYETEENGSPAQIRARAYWALCSGVAGSSFCHAVWWKFREWKSYMNTQGTLDNKRWFEFSISRPWYKLIPDTAHVTMTSGMGIFGSDDYACAARAIDGSTIIAYLPSSRLVTIELSKLSGSHAKAWWYNPVTGLATLSGTYRTRGTRQFTPPSGGDWLLVIDDASLNLPAPGATKM